MLLMGITNMFGPAQAQSPASGPSFSCLRAPEGGVEEMICRDPALARQDRVMAAAFGRARVAVRGREGRGREASESVATESEAWDELLSSQQSWLRDRAACADLRTQKGYCVNEITAKRITYLNQWAAAGINPERSVSRPQKAGSTASSRPPPGPSFDCATAGTTIERTICSSRDVSLSDRHVASLYGQLQRLVANNAVQAALFQTDQRSFIANRNRCARRPHMMSA